MKKFLSLVLALVMTMSLVTIGAGATEYKDLTDKGEIQYEEAVAVLNKLGIITGYEDGSFKPTGALTRGAAAKIIVSLMIGSEAASNLTVAAAPYKDVATTNTFAAVISYCKTAGYISGYTDGTFRPTAALTGYAFAKMLLGALGYDGAQEGFTGSGWTMNVAKLGNTAGLFNDFATAFSGNAGVTREGACLLALNTLKATEVQYSGGTNITTTTGNATTNVSTQKERSYVTSNNTKINANIKGQDQGNTSAYLTLQFGEEHFSDLKLTADGTAQDDFGRPANEWSYKNVKVGTYAQTADYVYTTTPSGDTSVDKVKSMGLKDYEFSATDTTFKVNGKSVTTFVAGKTTLTTNADLLKSYAKDGNKVEIYLSADSSNLITNVVVTETQVMQVNRVNSSNVTLKRVESSGIASTVSAVESDDDCYATLKDLKADAFVVVTPLTTNEGASYDVNAVYVPQTVTGNISKVKVNSSDNNTSGLTVGGTDYKVSFNWTAEDANGTPSNALNGTSISSSQQSTVYLDSYGFAIYVANVKASTSYFLFDETYASVVDGRIHYLAQGYDTKGNTVSLDFGTTNPGLTVNTVYAYKAATSNSNADYQLDSAKQASNVKTNTGVLSSSDTKISTYYLDSGVKYIYPTVDTNVTPNDVTGITVKDGAQNVKSSTYTYILNNDSPAKVTAVFLADDSDVEVSTNVMYVQKQTYLTQDASGKDVSVFTGYIDGVKSADLVANKKVVGDTFYTYAESNGIYTVNAYTQSTGKATSVITGATILNATDIKSNAYIDSGVLKVPTSVDGTGYLTKNLNLNNAVVVDLRDGGKLSTTKDIAESGLTNINVSLVYNDSSSSSSQGRVAYVYILSANTTTALSSDLTFVSGGSDVAPRYYVEDGSHPVLTNADVVSLMTKQGCTNIVKNGSNWDYTYQSVNYTNQTVSPVQVYKVTISAVTGTLADTTAAWTIDGAAKTAGTYYVPATKTVVCTLTTGATGFTATTSTALVGSTGATATATFATGTAPTASGTTVNGFTAEAYKTGTMAFTWTVAADIASATVVKHKVT